LSIVTPLIVKIPFYQKKMERCQLMLEKNKSPFRLRDARVAGLIPTQGEKKKKKGYILSRDSEVTLSHWSRSIELVITPLIDL
jgi:hypothetical protein